MFIANYVAWFIITCALFFSRQGLYLLKPNWWNKMKHAQRNSKFPWGECNQATKSVFNLEFICYICGLPNSDSTLFDSSCSFSSLALSENCYIPWKYAKSLNIAFMDYKSTFSKRATLTFWLALKLIKSEYPTELFSH